MGYNTESKPDIIFLDVDGTITDSKVVCWIEYTRQLFIFGGHSEEEAELAAQEHVQCYQRFRDKKSIARLNKSPSESEKLENEALEEMNEELVEIWNRSGVILTEENVKLVVDLVLENVITSEASYLLSTLTLLDKEFNIPTCVLTGSFNLLATGVSEKYNFSGGGLASSVLKSRILNGVAVFDVIEHDSDLAENKVRNSFLWVQSNARSSTQDISLARSIVIGDGPTDKLMFQLVGRKNSIAIAGTTEKQTELRPFSSHIVSNPDGAASVLHYMLPEDIRLSLLSAPRDRS